MSCVNPSESVDFSCILEAIKDIRSGEFSVTTIRKLLKQVDAGLSLLGGQDQPSTLAANNLNNNIQNEDVDVLCTKIEAVCETDKSLPSTQAVNPVLVQMLVSLLIKVLTKKLLG